MCRNICFLLHVFSLVALVCANVGMAEENGLPSYSKSRVDIPNIPEPDAVPVKRTDLSDPVFHAPIKLNEEERNLMRLNNPVVINYLARPEQVLVLMEH